MEGLAGYGDDRDTSSSSSGSLDSSEEEKLKPEGEGKGPCREARKRSRDAGDEGKEKSGKRSHETKGRGGEISPGDLLDDKRDLNDVRDLFMAASAVTSASASRLPPPPGRRSGLSGKAGARGEEEGQGKEEEEEWQKPDALGRVRRFAPEIGTYACMVMIPVRLPDEAKARIKTLISEMRMLVPGLQAMTPDLDPDCKETAPQAGVVDPATASLPSLMEPKGGETGVTTSTTAVLHLSLSRTLPVKFHLIGTLLQELREGLGSMPGGLATARLGRLTCFTNDERTRSFLSLSIGDESKQDKKAIGQILRMIGIVNRAFIMHGLEVYYKDPRPHVSVAWVAGDRKAELEKALEQLSSTSADTQGIERERALEQLTATTTSGGPNQDKAGEEGALQGNGSAQGATEEGKVQSGDLLLPWTDMPLDSVICRLGTQDHKVWLQGPPPQ